MERLMSLYDEYRQNLERFKSKMKPADGLFGFGTGLGDAPCHDEFAEKLEALLLAMAEEESFRHHRETLEWIYQAPLREQEKAAYWMMMAVHKLTLPLIEKLDARDAAELLQWYQGAYPMKDRLPPQTMVLQALKKQGKGTGSSSGFGWWKKNRS